MCQTPFIINLFHYSNIIHYTFYYYLFYWVFPIIHYLHYIITIIIQIPHNHQL